MVTNTKRIICDQSFKFIFGFLVKLFYSTHWWFEGHFLFTSQYVILHDLDALGILLEINDLTQWHKTLAFSQIITEKMKKIIKKIRLLAWLGWQEVEEHPAREERKKPSNWQEPAAAIEYFKVVRFDLIFICNGKLL